MAQNARLSMVSVFRKLRNYEEADKAVREVIESRQRTIGLKNLPTVDAIIHRIVLYLDMSRDSEAMQLIDSTIEGGLVDTSFERLVQVEHVRALLAWFAENVDLAVSTFASLLDRASRVGVEGRNRSLLWARLDFAEILRKQGRNDEASMLFDDILTSENNSSECLWVKSQTPQELKTAEQVITLLRERKTREADLVLKEAGLIWVRERDFWLLAGYPPTDTAWMKRPSGTIKKACTSGAE